ncbi:hypothetical protein MVEN_01745200 [Mycena venus]|uniref:Uncharacterized protein n=1 Tax=Mycena venus TaxID=2733690 RepID=A0A8H6XMT6_9AGAR|nr:hypothetical protein MVEN_01745200 [Mycena venus]
MSYPLQLDLVVVHSGENSSDWRRVQFSVFHWLRVRRKVQPRDYAGFSEFSQGPKIVEGIRCLTVQVAFNGIDLLLSAPKPQGSVYRLTLRRRRILFTPGLPESRRFALRDDQDAEKIDIHGAAAKARQYISSFVPPQVPRNFVPPSLYLSVLTALRTLTIPLVPLITSCLFEISLALAWSTRLESGHSPSSLMNTN